MAERVIVKSLMQPFFMSLCNLPELASFTLAGRHHANAGGSGGVAQQLKPDMGGLVSPSMVFAFELQVSASASQL